jgi:siroheme decarboxylase
MTMRSLDDLDQRLLNLLQTEMPLVERPYAELGRRLGVAEEDVVARVAALKGRTGERAGVIRQISAIFDSKSLGYQSTLVAAQVAPERLEAAAAVINKHPGVSHNYQRNHAFNLWYTLAVPPDSELGLEKTLEVLHAQSGAISTRMLPTLKLFKIGVRFDLGGGEAEAPAATYNEASRTRASKAVLTERDRAMVRVLQQDLPATAEPYAGWAEQAGVSVAELLATARDFGEQGLMRRFSAVLRHWEVGISANAMGVWAVPPPAEQQEAFGVRAAEFPAVSHCYLRRSYADWPYTMFTMVHAPTKEKCEQVLAEISAATGIREYSALYSTREFKKVRVKYFLDDVAAWERGLGK